MSKKIGVNSNQGLYTGNVKLTLKKGNNVYKVVNQHNAGTKEFFIYILNAIKGDIKPNERPGKVKLIYRQGAIDVVSRYGVMYTEFTDAKSTGTDDNPKATIIYKFVVPETVVDMGTLVGLQLEGVSGSIYAKVYFQEHISISKNTNIELDWELNISNG